MNDFDEFSLAVRLAEVMGAQALPLFFAGLAGVLIATCLAHMVIQRIFYRPWPFLRGERADLTPGGLLLRRLVLGFAIVVGAAAVFASIAEELGDGRAIGELDQVFSDAVKAHLAPQAYAAFALLTRLADTATLVGLGGVVSVALLVARQPWLASAWLMALGGNSLLNVSLKAVFARARPLHEGALVQAQGFSFPSGHSSGSVVAYGMLAYVLLRCLPEARARPLVLPLMCLAATLAFSVGCSRIFLQVHFATDVLAGFASGSVWLAICIGSMEVLRHRQHAATLQDGAPDLAKAADGKVSVNTFSGR
jgi:membrane-associated phospholipid phosphatase